MWRGPARARRVAGSVRIRARLISEALNRGGFRFDAAMITLTYARIEDWRARDVAEFTDRVRKHQRRRGVVFRYVWVAELQQRGAVHYHLIVWLPHRMRLPKPDDCGWWPHGSTKIELARKPVGYLAKYASKCEWTAEFPRGLRLCGAGGLEAADRRIAAWVMLPADVRAVSEPGERVLRAKGGGFIIERTGEFIRSRWRLVQISELYLRFRQLPDIEAVPEWNHCGTVS